VAANARAIGSALGLDLPEYTLKIVLPVGISFYIFQTLSYTIDVRRGRLAPRRSLLDFATFVAFFPQLVAGPIERASHLLPQAERERRWDWERFFSAWPLLLRGYLKKLVFTDSIAGVVDRVFMLKEPSLALLLAGGLCFALQIFADFWRRWHVSLSTWIRDYVYVPLGGSRVKGRLAQLRVLLVTFGLSGLWHGAAWNFD
jgi:D-alanyl-lipoteichoic acid acyltransferase DltB (MBOAT superfamily)